MRLGGGFDVPAKAKEIDKLEAESLASSFWDDQQDAQKKMQSLSVLRDIVETWDGLERRASQRAATEDGQRMTGTWR